MRKGIKISVHIVSALLLALILLPLLVVLAIQLPAVQNFAVRRASEWASEKLQARVSIDRINIKLISRAEVEGFYVEDYGGDTLLYVGRVEADILNTGLMGGTFTLGNARLANIRFKMHEDPDSTSNFRKIIEKIKRKNPPEVRNPFPLFITDVRVENMRYSMVRQQIRTDRGGSVNFSDVDVERFDLTGHKVFIKGDSVNLTIDNMSIREKSGFYIPHFSARIDNLSGSGIDARELRLQTGRTDLKLASLKFHSQGWPSFRDFIDAIPIEGEIEPSTIDMATIGAFAPKVAGLDYVFHDLRGRAEGLVRDLAGTIPNISLYGTSLSFDFRMRGLPDIQQAVFDVNLRNLSTSEGDIERILEPVLAGGLPPRMASFLDGLGSVSFSGDFNGSIHDFTANGELDSEQTRAVFNFSMAPAGDDMRSFAGTVGAYGVNAGALAGVAKLGRTGVRASVSGTMGGGTLKGETDATVALLEFNGYRYRDIGVAGSFDNRMFTGHVESGDPNIDFDFDGTLDFNDSIPAFDFVLGLRRADLAALNFIERDSVAILKADVRAVATGNSPDNLNGEVTITDLTYINEEDSLWTGRVEIKGRNSETSKYLSFSSYFADAEYRSRTSYRELFGELKRAFQSYLPALSSPAEANIARPSGGYGSPDNYSLLSVNIKQANKAVGVFVPGLLLAQGSQLSFMFNPDNGRLLLSASSEFIEYNNNFVSNLEVTTRNEGDSLSFFVRADDMYAGRLFMPILSLNGGVKDNRINASAGFVDSTRNTTALVGIASHIRRDSTGLVRTRIRFTPSRITIGERIWNIYSRGIVIDSTRVEINDFTIAGAGQSLVADGVLSRHRSDTLHVNLTNFDLEPLTNFTSRLGYIVAGRTNGHADLVSARQDPLLHARIEFDSIRLNDKLVPNGLFESTWDAREERIRMLLTRRELGDTIVRGYFSPSTGEYLGRATLKQVDVSFIEPFFKGIVRDVAGSVDVDATVSGQKRQLKVNGKAWVDNMAMTVDFLNVEYQVRDAWAEVKDNVIVMNDVPVYDRYDNTAMFDMNVDLNSTQNINYYINVRPENILAMDMDANYNDMFYGRVFGSGSVIVSGNRRGVNIDIKATSAPNSEFNMALRDYSLGIADIITFRERREERPELSDIARRKMEIIRSRRRRARAEAAEANMNLNMDLRAGPELLFQLIIDPSLGEGIRARGNANMTIHYNPSVDEFTMNGDYELSEGSYHFSLQGLISKRFALEPGSRITWVNEPLDAQMNVSAVYPIKASLAPLLANYNTLDKNFSATVPVDCRIILSGSLTDPDIRFEVDVQNVDPEIRSIIANELSTQENVSTQFLSLVALHSFYNSGAGNIGSAGGSTTAIDFLSSQLSNLITNDNIHIGVRYNQRSQLTSDEVMLDLQAKLFGSRLVLDIEGNYNAQNAPPASQNTNTLSGDFALTWLIDRPGNLRLKGFTRTIDRFDENQGLQESGVGISYREDFNTVGDIVRNFRERFSRKERRERKRAEKEALREDEEYDRAQEQVAD